MQQAEYFAVRGLIAVRPDYRVRARYDAPAERCFEDGRSAIRWLRQNADSLGIDPNAIVGSGGSAGAILSAAITMSDALEPEGEDQMVSSKADALLLFSPALLFSSLDTIVENIRTHEIKDGCYEKTRSDLAGKVAPILYLTRTTVPTAVFVGDYYNGDYYDYYPDALAFFEKAKELDHHTELYIAETGWHGFYGSPNWYAATMYEAERFLFSLGYFKEEPQKPSNWADLAPLKRL